MNLTLRLSAEDEAQLREHAAATGKEPEQLALEALHEKLARESVAPRLSSEEWLRQCDEWVRNRKSRHQDVDDSRDSIYPD